MNPAPPSTTPRLAPPGAGLPQPELAIGRLLFVWHRWRTSRVASAELFARERDTVLRLAQSLPAAVAAEPVLIKRLPGLEDSSRYWSVFMVLEHLRITNLAMLGVMRALRAGRVPPGQVSTAAIKPAPGVGSEVLTTFATGCAELLDTVAVWPDLAGRLTYAHPWFGKLDVAGWFALAGYHQRLHRKQLERILVTLI